MTHPLFEKHQATLQGALQAIATRGYWSPFAEMPSPKAYGETAADDGKRAYEAHLGRHFELQQPGQSGWIGSEVSPYGGSLNVRYPQCDHEALVAAGAEAEWPLPFPFPWPARRSSAFTRAASSRGLKGLVR